MQIKILVVDDSTTDRMIIKNMLKEYTVYTACDGVEALEMMDKCDCINILILDLNMPRVDGFEVLKTIKEKNTFKKMRTIILTNYDEIHKEIMGLKLGAVDYIRKPIHMESLKARLDVHVTLLKVQYELEHQLNEQGKTYQKIFEQVPVGIAISHSKDPVAYDLNKYTSVNPALERITGRSKEELLKLGWASITHPKDIIEDLDNYKKLQAKEISEYSMVKRFIKPDGSYAWVHMIVTSLDLEVNEFNHIAIFTDITESKIFEQKLSDSERSKKILLNHIPGMAYRCDFNREWTMRFVSVGCIKLTGYPPESLIDNRNLSFYEVIAPEYRDELWEEWQRILPLKEEFNYEYEITTASGERKWVLELAQGVYDEEGNVEALEGIIIDISDRKAIEDILIYNNDHDKWTGLYNRAYLEIMLNNDSKIRDGKKRALFSLNLNDLHRLTIAYGFHYTQNIILKVANQLSMFCGENQILFKTYENRFVIYYIDYKSKDELIEFGNSIIEILKSILALERVGGGLGVYEIDQELGLSADEMMKGLLFASEKAAENNENDFRLVFYDCELENTMLHVHEIENELFRIAMDEIDGLYLHYQPILDLQTNKISGFEALARLKTETLGNVSPLEFIPIAEKTKLIVPIGNKIFRHAFNFINKIKQNGFDDINVSINVSVHQWLKADFCKNLIDLMKEMQVPCENVGIEITESLFVSDHLEINKKILELQNNGVKIYIDDFGTGYSSLSRVSELNTNFLKIDKYFADILHANPKKSIIADIISMAHRFNHRTVAEGVEMAEQMHYLKDFGCDHIQGYYISRPLDEDAALEFLHSYNKRNK